MSHTDALENLNQDLHRRLALPASDLILSADSLSFLAEEIGRIQPAECEPAELVLLDQATRDLRNVTQKAIRALYAEAHRLVATNTAYTLATIDEARAGLRQASQHVSLADKLGGDEAGDIKQRNLFDQALATLQDRLRSSERFIAVRDSISVLHTRARGLETTDPVRAVDLYNEARTEAQNALSEAGWSDEEQDALYKIHGEARMRYDEIRKRLEIPTTLIAGQTVEAVRLFARLDKAYPAGQNHPERQVNYFTGPSPIDVPRVQDVEEALSIARIKLVDHWDERVREYARQSDEFLAAHKPQDAQISLNQWQHLPGLNDELVGVSFPDNLRIRIRDMQKRVSPELEAYNKGDKCLERALQKLDEPGEALKEYAVAQVEYPFHPGLPDVLNRITQAARNRIEELLTQADKALTRESTWRQVEPKLKGVESCLSEFTSLRDEFENRLDSMKSVFELVVLIRSKSGKTQKLSASEERDVLSRLRDLLEADETSYWHQPGWQTARNRLSALESQTIVQDTLAHATQACAVEASLAEMSDALRAIDQLRQDPPENLAPSLLESLVRASQQMVTWIGYAAARDQIHLHDEGMPADLSIVKQGLEAARGAQTLPVGKLRELQMRHDALVLDDSEAREALKTAQGLRRSPPDTEDTALTWFKDIDKWSNCTTSYRAEFLRLRSTAEVNAQRVIEREIKQLVDGARDAHYETLDLRRLEALCSHGRLVNAGPGAPWDAWLNGAPALMARAAQHERDARREPALWQSVENQWKVIVNRLSSADPEFAYCELKMKQARKQAAFQASKTLERPAAERALGELLKDPSLALDAEVWLHHGQYCLQSVQDMLESELNSATPVRPSAQAARSSLVHAQQFTDSHSAATASLSELSQWECVLDAELEIAGALRVSGNGRLTREQCLIVVDSHRTVLAKLASASRQAKAFTKFWDSQKHAARAQLDRQWAEASLSTFDKLDTLTAMLTFAPGDENVQAQLTHELLNARQEFARAVTEVIGDYEGEKYRQRHRSTEADAGFQHDQLAARQRDETAALMKSGGEIVAAHRLVERQLGSQGAYTGNVNSNEVLSRELTDLEQWQQDLSRLIDALAVARNRAIRGLQSPREFEAARYALRMQQSHIGSGSRMLLPQIPDVFAGHSGVESIKELLKENARRYESQRKLACELDICLSHVTAVQPSQLAGVTLQRCNDEFSPPFDATAFLNQLRNRMEAESNPALPVEIALEKLQQMRREEPDDACGLQARLRFIDTENGNREYIGDHNIEIVLAPWARQVVLLRDWLTTYKSGLRLTGIDFPGAVSFDTRLLGIQRLRDSDPNGLVDARKRCLEARTGNGADEKLVDGLWPLERMRDALSPEAMLAYLAAKTKGLSPATSTDIPFTLCAATKKLDEERETLRADYERQITACLAFEQDIQRRIRQYDEAWLRFETAYADLMQIRRRFFGARRISESDQWARFRECADKFCNICPEYKDFKDKLTEVKNKFNLDAGCPDSPEGVR